MLTQSQQTVLLLLKGIFSNNKTVYCHPNSNNLFTQSVFIRVYS
jgi:hypothetical protein